MIGISKKKGQTFFALFVVHFQKIFHFRFSDLTEGVQVSPGNVSTLAFLSNIVHVQLYNYHYVMPITIQCILVSKERETLFACTI